MLVLNERYLSTICIAIYSKLARSRRLFRNGRAKLAKLGAHSGLGSKKQCRETGVQRLRPKQYIKDLQKPALYKYTKSSKGNTQLRMLDPARLIAFESWSPFLRNPVFPLEVMQT